MLLIAVLTGWALFPEDAPFRVSEERARLTIEWTAPQETKDALLLVEKVTPYRRNRLILQMRPRGNSLAADLPLEAEVFLVAWKVEYDGKSLDNQGKGFAAYRLSDGKPARGALRELARITEAWDRREADRELEKALPLYERAVNEDPEDPWNTWYLLQARRRASPGLAQQILQQAQAFAEQLATQSDPDSLYVALRILTDQTLGLRAMERAAQIGRRFLRRFPEHPLAEDVRWRVAYFQGLQDPLQMAQDLMAFAQDTADPAARSRALITACKALRELERVALLERCVRAYLQDPYWGSFFWDGIFYVKQWLSYLHQRYRPAAVKELAEQALALLRSEHFTVGYLWRFPVTRETKRRFHIAEYLLLRAEAEIALDELQQAEETVLSALEGFEEDPDRARAYFLLSRIRNLRGQKEGALRALQEAVRADPYQEEYAAELRKMWKQLGRPRAQLNRFLQDARQKAERPAPGFRVRLLEGGTFVYPKQKPDILVLNFWATWCGPCVREIPALNALVKKFRDRGNIVFLAITAETAPTVRRFLKKQEFLYQIAVEGRTAINTYKAFAYPTHVVIDYAGRIRYRQMGATENIGAKLENVIQSILRDLELRRPPASR